MVPFRSWNRMWEHSQKWKGQAVLKNKPQYGSRKQGYGGGNGAQKKM